MGYEQAPATKLLAQHCCHCGKELLDADSVQAGMGPTCRKRFLNHPDVNPNIPTALQFAHDHMKDEEFASVLFEALQAADAHKAANILTHHIAARTTRHHVPGGFYGRTIWTPTFPVVAWMIHCINALGYTHLAKTIARRLYRVVVWKNGNEYQVAAEFNHDFIDGMRAMKAQYDKVTRTNRLPDTMRSPLFLLLKKVYKGCLGFTPAGEYKF